MRLRTWLWATVVAGLAGPANANGLLDGAQLFRDCQADTASGQGFCLGYTSGIADILVHRPVNGFKVCFVEKVSAGQIKDVVSKWLKDHPERRQYGAPGLVANALAEAYPCAKR